MVDRLARLLGVDPSIVWNDEALPVPNLLAFLRDSWGGLVPEDYLVLRRSLSQAKALREAGWQPELAYSPKRAPSVRTYRDGYSLARRLRRDLGNPADPLFDLRGLVESRLGVLVSMDTLVTPRLEALAVAGGDAAAILLNRKSNIDPSKQRRSVAHELCHVLFDPREKGAVVDTLEAGSDDSQGVPEKHEQRARAFAAELLVPRIALDRLFKDSTSIPDLAALRTRQVCAAFGAPWELVVWHLMNHGKIDKTSVEPLLRAPERPGSAFTLGTPSALCWARTQVDEGEISSSRMRDLFGQDWDASLER